MRVFDHAPDRWFLLEDDGVLFLDRTASGKIGLIALSAQEADRYREQGRAYIEALLKSIDESATAPEPAESGPGDRPVDSADSGRAADAIREWQQARSRELQDPVRRRSARWPSDRGPKLTLRMKVIGWSQLIAFLSFIALSYYSISGGLYGFLAKRILYVASAWAVGSVLTVWLLWVILRRGFWLRDLFTYLARSGILRALYRIPGAIVVAAGSISFLIFIIAHCVGVVFSWLPYPVEHRQLVMQSKRISLQADTCRYQADVEMQGDTWRQQCLTRTQFKTMQPGVNDILVKNTPVGYMIQ